MTCLEFIEAYCEPTIAKQLKKKLHDIKNEPCDLNNNDLYLGQMVTEATGKFTGWRDVKDFAKKHKRQNGN